MKLYLLGISLILAGVSFGMSNLYTTVTMVIAVVLAVCGLVFAVIGLLGKNKKVEVDKMKPYLAGIGLIFAGIGFFANSRLSDFMFGLAAVLTGIGVLLSLIGAVKADEINN